MKTNYNKGFRLSRWALLDAVSIAKRREMFTMEDGDTEADELRFEDCGP